MSILADAIVRREWELASLCLLVGLWQTVAESPADAIESVIDLAGENVDVQKKDKKAAGFYDQALDKAERLRMPHARKIEGLDEEIALLRVRLGRLVEEHPENLELLLKAIGMLVRAVGARYKLSPKAEDDLRENMLEVINGIGGALKPDAAGDREGKGQDDAA